MKANFDSLSSFSISPKVLSRAAGPYRNSVFRAAYKSNRPGTQVLQIVEGAMRNLAPTLIELLAMRRAALANARISKTTGTHDVPERESEVIENDSDFQNRAATESHRRL